MTVNRTTLLNLPLPVTGTESGTWGDTTNNGLSQYMDIAIAGMTSLTSANFTAGALTLANTTGDSSATNIAASSAQYGAIKVSSLAVASTITAPSSNRRYVIINADATYNLTFKATGQTGVTLLPGQSAVVAFNGTDYVIVGTVGAGTATDNAVARFDGTTGEILQNSAATIDDTGAATFVGSVNVSGTSASAADLKLYEDTDNGTNYVAFKSPASVASNVTWTLPSADGTNGQALTTNGSGTLAFSSVTTAPGGSDTQVQYNNAGAFAGSANFVWDNSNVRLGIGTSSPQTLLQVSSVTPIISLRESDGAADEKSFDLRVNSKEFSIRSVNDAYSAANNVIAATRSTGIDIDNVRFFTGAGSERMRVSSNGTLLIGGTSAATGTNTQYSFVQIIGNNAGGANYGSVNLLRNEDSANITVDENIGMILFGDRQAGEYASIRVLADGTAGSGDYPGRMSFFTTADGAASSTERMRITSGGNLLVGTTTNNASGGVIQVSNGITFPATQSASTDANTLDDYEEGTWTPSLGGNTTYSNQTGTYTKIGRQVTVKCRLAVSSIGTGSTRTISGLPFTPGETATTTAPYFENVSTNIVYLSFSTNSTTLDSYSATAATGTLTGAANPIFKNGTIVEFYCTYFV